MNMNRSHLIAILLLPGVLGLPAPIVVAAQGITDQAFEAPQQDTATVEREPVPIPAAEVPLRAAGSHSRLRGFQAQTSADPDIVAIERELPDELESLSRAHDQIGRVVFELQSLRQLTDLRQTWRRYESKLQAWKDILAHEWTELGEVFEAVSFMQATWDLTREAEVAHPETSAALIERIDAVLSEAGEVEAGVQRQMERILGLDEQIDEALAGASEVMSELVDAEESVRARIVVRNAPPLWAPAAWRARDTGRGLRRPWQEEWQAVQDLVRFDLHRVLLHLLTFALILAIAIRLRSRIEDEPSTDDPELRAAAETLAYPVSAALLLALLLADPMYPRASFTVRQIFGFIAVVPMWRLLPRSRVKLVNHTMRALLVLVAVTGVAQLVVEPLADYRFLDLTLAIVIVAGAWWLVRNEAPGADDAGAWGMVVVRGLKVAIAAAALAILANALGWVLLSTMILTVLIGTAYTGLGTVIGYRVLAGIVRLTPHSRFGQASRALRLHGDVITSRIIRFLKITALPLWIWLSLQYIEFDEPAAEWLRRLLDSSIQVGILHISLASVLNFAITLLLTIWLARFVRFVLDEEVLPRFSIERGVSSALSTVSQWTILGIGFLAAAGAAGLGASQLALVAGALGVGIGFGLQGIVNNFVSGLILIFEQPVKVGDKVEITSLGLTGEVRRIGIRASIVREFNGAEVIVPNANLISSEVVNWTLSDQRRRIRTEIGVAYGSDPSRVIEILKGVATAHPEVLKYPEPQVIFLGFGDSSLSFRLMSWTGTFDNFLRIRSELNVATHDAIRDAEITIPFPQRDLHIRSLPASARLPLSAAELDSGAGGAGAQGPEDKQNPA